MLDQTKDGMFTRDDLDLLSSSQIWETIKIHPGDINTVGVSQKVFSDGKEHVSEYWPDDEDQDSLEADGEKDEL